jgi:hypothetical protein
VRRGKVVLASFDCTSVHNFTFHGSLTDQLQKGRCSTNQAQQTQASLYKHVFIGRSSLLSEHFLKLEIDSSKRSSNEGLERDAK